MRHVRNTSIGLAAFFAAATIMGCNATQTSQGNNASVELSSESSAQNSDRIYLSQLKSTNDLTYYKDLEEEFVFACSDKEGQFELSHNKGHAKDKKSKKDDDDDSSRSRHNQASNRDECKDRDAKDRDDDDDGKSSQVKDKHPKQPGRCTVICHVPPGNPGKQKTLIIGLSALEAHLTHGPGEVSLDYLGPCGNRDDDDDGGSDDGSNEEDPDTGGDDGSNEEDPDSGTDDGSNEETPDTGTGDGSNEETPDTGTGDGDPSTGDGDGGGSSTDDPPVDPDL